MVEWSLRKRYESKMKATFAKITTAARVGMGFALALAALSQSAQASIAPELDPGSMGSALALLSVGMLMVAGRRRR